MEVGSIAEFLSIGVEFLSIGVSAITGVLAIFYASQANATANQANQRQEVFERAQHEREQRKLDIDLHQDSLARTSSIQAWWATKDDTWGIFVTNTGNFPVVYRDVEIKVLSGQYGPRPVSIIKQLPPGKFFIESLKGTKGWNLTTVKNTEIEKYEPIILTAKYSVEEISYTTPLNERWTWRQDSGIQRSGSTPTD